MNFAEARTERILPDFAIENNVAVSILRLDKIHAVVSGNKWYKLKYYLQRAAETKASTIATFGGAYSNHLVATAYAAQAKNLQSFGVVRGEQPEKLSHTLENALQFGMQLHFVSREEYTNKADIQSRFKDFFWINEGGFGTDGAKGIADIATDFSLHDYSHIITAVGTGTTFAGIIKSAGPHQKIIGISVMKNNFGLMNDINTLLTAEDRSKDFALIHDFHFGGYAKKTTGLIDYINYVYETTHVPLDFVYTAKAFFGMQQLIEQKTIAAGSNILFIHTGGLQGNLSLPKGILKF